MQLASSSAFRTLAALWREWRRSTAHTDWSFRILVVLLVVGYANTNLSLMRLSYVLGQLDLQQALCSQQTFAEETARSPMKEAGASNHGGAPASAHAAISCRARP